MNWMDAIFGGNPVEWYGCIRCCIRLIYITQQFVKQRLCSVDCVFVWTSKDVSCTFWQWFMFCDIFYEAYLLFLFSHLNLKNVTFTRHLYYVRLLDVSLHTFHRSLRHIQKFSAILLWSEWFLHMIYAHTHTSLTTKLVGPTLVHPSIHWGVGGCRYWGRGCH